jgi:hypothetical protein
MNRSRIVLLGILAVLVAVWVSSATLPPPAPPAAPPAPAKAAKPTRSAAQSAGTRRQAITEFDLNDAAERLRARVDTAPRPQSPERNPFEFGHAPAPRMATTPAVPAALQAIEPAAPPPPPLTLTGMAEHKKAEGLERTAILSSNNQIYFAKTGDRVLGRYEVTAISTDAIELRDVESGQIVRLGLR